MNLVLICDEQCKVTSLQKKYKLVITGYQFLPEDLSPQRMNYV